VLLVKLNNRSAAAVLSLLAIALCVLVVVATARADVNHFGVRSQPLKAATAWTRTDGYCDGWNFAKDADCRAARYQYAPTPPTGATGWTGATGATGTDWRGDTDWPSPPKHAYARFRPDGRTVVAPKSAPRAVKRMVRAANSLTKKPYVWGGGHSRWYDNGYDCSGATSFVLRAGGYLSWPMVSGELAYWGSNGPGRWVRVYASGEHVFMIIAGLRFDTSPWFPGERGPRWRATVRGTKGFALRHPLRL
jgi:cell wall-associated NlpC family hydrolase